MYCAQIYSATGRVGTPVGRPRSFVCFLLLLWPALSSPLALPPLPLFCKPPPKHRLPSRLCRPLRPQPFFSPLPRPFRRASPRHRSPDAGISNQNIPRVQSTRRHPHRSPSPSLGTVLPALLPPLAAAAAAPPLYPKHQARQIRRPKKRRRYASCFVLWYFRTSPARPASQGHCWSNTRILATSYCAALQRLNPSPSPGPVFAIFSHAQGLVLVGCLRLAPCLIHLPGFLLTVCDTALLARGLSDRRCHLWRRTLAACFLCFADACPVPHARYLDTPILDTPILDTSSRLCPSLCYQSGYQSGYHSRYQSA